MINTLLYPFLVTFNAGMTLASAIKDSLVSIFDDLAYYTFGYTNIWCFFDNEHLPIQVRYVSPTYMVNIDYYYNNKYHVWYDNYKNTVIARIPWITATLELDGVPADLTEFIMEQKVRINPCNPVYPSPDMLVAAWSLKTGTWLSFEDRCSAVLKVMDDDLNEFELPLVVNSDEEVNKWGEAYGIENYVRNLYGWGGDDSSDSSDSGSDGERSEAHTDTTDESQTVRSELAAPGSEAAEPEPDAISENETDISAEVIDADTDVGVSASKKDD